MDQFKTKFLDLGNMSAQSWKNKTYKALTLKRKSDALDCSNLCIQFDNAKCDMLFLTVNNY